MLRIVGPVLLGALLFSMGRAAAAEPLKVHLISGSDEYKSDASLSALAQYLEQNHWAVCTRSFGKDKGTELPGLEALDNADVAIIFTRRITLSDENLGRLKKYIDAGRPLVGVRTASHAFQNFLQLDKTVWGGNYQGHDTTTAGEVNVVEAAKGHPILAGVQGFSTPGRIYKNDGHANDIEILLTGSDSEINEPVAWTHRYNGGRAFYTSLGQPADFENENFRRLLVNALFWVTDRPAPK